jgi:hypothetical protein
MSRYVVTDGELATALNPFSISTGEIGALDPNVGKSLVVQFEQAGSINLVCDNMRMSSAVVPEPGTLALLATGLIGLLAYAWRKRK